MGCMARRRQKATKKKKAKKSDIKKPSKKVGKHGTKRSTKTRDN